MCVSCLCICVSVCVCVCVYQQEFCPLASVNSFEDISLIFVMISFGKIYQKTLMLSGFALFFCHTTNGYNYLLTISILAAL